MKKAKLDILENIPNVEIEEPAAQVAPPDDVEVPVESGRKWAFNKLVLIGAPIVVVVLIVGGILFYYLTKTISHVSQTPTAVKKAEPAPAHPTADQTLEKQNSGAQTIAVPETLKTVYFKDFIIDLKDASGNNRVLMCDVALDVGGEQKQEQLENNTDVRNIIYRKAQSRSAVALRSVEERKKLKKELVVELGKMLGDGSVKNIYFINYFIM